MPIVTFQQLTPRELDELLRLAGGAAPNDSSEFQRLLGERLVHTDGRLTDIGRSVLSTRSC